MDGKPMSGIAAANGPLIAAEQQAAVAPERINLGIAIDLASRADRSHHRP
jgi:hypothetical protein